MSSREGATPHQLVHHSLLCTLLFLHTPPHCSALDFHEVTALFQQLAPQQSAESAQNAAVEALLMSDKNTDTKLSKAEFAELLSK